MLSIVFAGAIFFLAGYAAGARHERHDQTTTTVRRADRPGTWREDDEPRSSGIRELICR